MGLPISGKSGDRADVNEQGQLLVSSSQTPAIIQAALEGRAFVWHSQDLNIDAADTMLSVRNDSATHDLVIDRIQITGGNAVSRYEVHKITANAAFSTGSIILAMDLGNTGKVPDASAFTDDEGNTQGTVFMETAVAATTTIELDCGIVLGKTQILAVDQVSTNTAGAATFFGYFVER